MISCWPCNMINNIPSNRERSTCTPPPSNIFGLDYEDGELSRVLAPKKLSPWEKNDTLEFGGYFLVLCDVIEYELQLKIVEFSRILDLRFCYFINYHDAIQGCHESYLMICLQTFVLFLVVQTYNLFHVKLSFSRNLVAWKKL